MPHTQEYSDEVSLAYETTQKEEGMTNENVMKLQELLRDYPENKELSIDGLYGEETIKAVNSFYDNHFWTPEKSLAEAQDRYGEKYIMKSELESMMKSPPDTAELV